MPIVLGAERRRRLQEFGFAPALIDALDAGSPLWADTGEVLAEIAELDAVRAMLPPGYIVPVCHLDESEVHYVLLVGDELLELHPEFTEPIHGGVLGFLTEGLVRAYEREEDEHALISWANAVGYPDADTLLREAATSRSHEQHRAWLRGFVDRLHAARSPS